MQIICPPEFHSVIKGHFILLDTNIFIDTLIQPVQFRTFFQEIKKYDVTLVTLEEVKMEFFKGLVDLKQLQQRQLILDSIVEAYLPVSKDMYSLIEKLLTLYGKDGALVSITDLLLGGVLMKYSANTILITKNIRDFPTSIYSIVTYFHLFHTKAIQNYAVYKYDRKKNP